MSSKADRYDRVVRELFNRGIAADKIDRRYGLFLRAIIYFRNTTRGTGLKVSKLYQNSTDFKSGNAPEEWTDFAGKLQSLLGSPQFINPANLTDKNIFDGVVEQLPSNEQDIIRAVLLALNNRSTDVKAVFDISPAGSVPTSARDFTFKLTNHLVRLRLQDSVQAQGSPSNLNQLFGSNVASGNAEFSRDSKGNLVDRNNQAADLLSISEDAPDKVCRDMGIDPDIDGQNCGEFIMKCMMNPNSRNISNCKNYLDSPQAFTAQSSAIDKAPIASLVTLLESVEWPFVNVDGVVRAGSTDQWLDKLEQRSKDKPSELDPREFQRIKGYDNLITYFGLVVERVNKSPAILNRGQPVVAQSTTRFAGNLLDKWGLKGRVETLSARAQVARLQSDVNNRNFAVRLGLGLPNMVGFSVPLNVNFQSGGSSLADLQARLNNVPSLSGNLLKNQYANLVSRLARRGKSIDQRDHAQVESLINSLLDSETKLSNIVSYGETYLDLLENFSSYDSDNVLSLSHLKEFVDQKDKYSAKVDKKQSAVLSILETIAKAIDESRQGSSGSSAPTNINVSSLLGRN
jgi:hypothetical protein